MALEAQTKSHGQEPWSFTDSELVNFAVLVRQDLIKNLLLKTPDVYSNRYFDTIKDTPEPKSAITRIDQLIQQVSTDISGKWISRDSVRTLAQLIVRECAKIGEDYGDDGLSSDPEGNRYPLNAGIAIRKHLGVEE